MIPRLAPGDALAADYLAFLSALPEAGFKGDIRLDQAARLTCATDNSVYQILPQGILQPLSRADVICVMSLLAEPQFRTVTLTARGGGTGTNGQSLTDGLVLDLSCHMNKILNIDLEAGHVCIQPGVVLDQLNDRLKPHGVFFAPNLSPSNRATIGGMIATDAAGKGSRIYGKTSEHVLELETILLNGTALRSKILDAEGLARVAQRNDRSGVIHRELNALVESNKDAIGRVFPDLRRFMTGYNLARLWDEERQRFDLNALISGSEGTLGVVVEARLKLTPIPRESRLLVLKYDQFQSALGSAQALIEFNPSAIETIDETIMELARQDALFPKIRNVIEDHSHGRVAAVNLVEFIGQTADEVDNIVRALLESLEEHASPFSPIGSHVARDDTEANALWALRKKGVGLLGNLPGRHKPVAFVEDTVVHPSRLREYIAEFREILDAEGVRYGMFGHVDVGCLHVRPALDLKDVEDEAKLRRISDKVSDLVHAYGGLIWGEHGKGFRSEYSPKFFGELYPVLQEVKALFDPHNQLNPGKVATPKAHPSNLVSIDAPKRGAFDRQISRPAQIRYGVALDCNGNGACFDYSPDTIMCPSSKVTRDRVHSPKGRAAVMREWLRQLSVLGSSPIGKERSTISTVLGMPRRWLNARTRKPDFSHDVYRAMEGCLSCKACATQCPIKVDVPSFKSEFLAAYHTRYPRRFRDYLVGALESAAYLGARLPNGLAAISKTGVVTSLLSRLGLIQTPTPISGLRRGLRLRGVEMAHPERLIHLSAAEREQHVIIVQDAFTSFFEPAVLLAAVDVLQRLGFQPLIAHFRPNGKGMHVKGFLNWFRRTARKNAEALRRLEASGIPLVGIEPAVTLTYRDEYSVEELGVRVHLLQEWLVKVLPGRILSGERKETYTLLGHCTERTACPDSQADWRRILAHFGLEGMSAAVGCCGMCGVFGHETEHAAESQGIYDMSWRPIVEQSRTDEGLLLATGYSCRTQVERFSGLRPAHPIQFIEEVTRPSTNAAGPSTSAQL